MNRGFWDNLPKPFFVLAPMYDVTDVAFRSVLTKIGKPNVFFTEFVSADGLVHPEGYKRLSHHLKYEESERPIVAQIFGKNPDNFYKAAKLISELGFDGLDLNTGCPDKNTVKQGAGAGLFKTPELAKEILLAMKEGAGETPVSVKIRIGDTKVDWENWIATLLEAHPVAISVHLRTRKEMSKVPAHWDEMPKIVNFIHNYHNNNIDHNGSKRPLIVGNGDVESVAHGQRLIAETGCDGVMIGRGIFENPWAFSKNPTEERSIEERLGLLKLHTQLFEQHFTGVKSEQVMKRFFKIYVHGFPHAPELREKLYNTENLQDVPEIVDEFIKT